MADQQAEQQVQVQAQAAGGEYNNNVFGIVALLAAIFLPRVFSRAWAELAIEASVPSALFFVIIWAGTSRAGKGRYRIAAAWYLAAIAITATLVGLVRFALMFVIGGRAVFHPSDFMNLVFVLILPVAFALLVATKLRSKIAVLQVEETPAPASTDSR